MVSFYEDISKILSECSAFMANDNYYDDPLSNDRDDILNYAKDNGVDLTIYYSNIEYSSEQLYQLCQGLMHGVDPLSYSDVNYSAGHMRQIRYALESGLDIAIFQNHLFPKLK